VLIPIAIFAVCLCAGVAGSARWLPPLADGPVGGIAFFAVCGLLGAGLALVGLHIYLIVEQLDHVVGGLGGIRKGDVVANGVQDLLFDAGAIFALALVVYLLAPRDSPSAELEARRSTAQPT
jgi:hypothetical protein